MTSLGVRSAGMMTALGDDADTTCTAIRCAMAQFVETEHLDVAAEPVIAAPVALDLEGTERLCHMLKSSIDECLAGPGGGSAERIPVLLCVSETTRPGRPAGLEAALLNCLQTHLGRRFHPRSATLAGGHAAIAQALRAADAMVAAGEVEHCIVAGVDSLIVSGTLDVLQQQRRVLTSATDAGFVPGEAAAAVLVGARAAGVRPEGQLLCIGIGEAMEHATWDSGSPLRADGMVEAIGAAFDDARAGYQDVDYRLCDLNGEPYGFREASLALSRTLRVRKPDFPVWHPADCIGEVGAAIGPCTLAVALMAARHGYAPGPGVLCHYGSDDGRRAAMVLRHERYDG
jgi:3-oxoacyl-[acyl-carrier-protein] synthase I